MYSVRVGAATTSAMGAGVAGGVTTVYVVLSIIMLVLLFVAVRSVRLRQPARHHGKKVR